MSVPMEVEIQEVSSLVAAVAAAIDASASESLPELQPLFADTIFEAPEPEAEESDAEADDEDESGDADAESDTDTEADDEAVPPEVTTWMNEIDNIEYHYRHDDDDRGYNFFRDTNGNTLYIQEFDLKGARYLNINREHIMKYEDFTNILCGHKEEGGVNVVTFGQQLLKNCSTDLLVEALTILADSDASSDTDSDSDSDYDASSEASSEEEHVPQPLPTKSDSESVQNFLLSFFIVLMCLRAIGLIGQLA